MVDIYKGCGVVVEGEVKCGFSVGGEVRNMKRATLGRSILINNKYALIEFFVRFNQIWY